MAECSQNIQEAERSQKFVDMVVSNMNKAEDKLKDVFLRKLKKAIKDKRLKLDPANVEIYLEGMLSIILYFMDSLFILHNSSLHMSDNIQQTF